MCLAPIGSIPPPIDMDGLAIGIELDISGIGDFVWPAAADGCPELPHAAATSASAPTPTAAFKAEPRRKRPGAGDLDMHKPPHVPAPRHPHHHSLLQRHPLKTPRQPPSLHLTP